MTESQIYTQIKEALGADYFLQRIENGVGVGVPDIYFSLIHPYKRLQGWIELKTIRKLPIKETTIIKLNFRPGQLAWHKKAIKAHIKTFLLVWTPIGFYIFTGNEIRGVYSKDNFFKGVTFKTLKESPKNISVYSGLPHYFNSLAEWSRRL